MSATTSSESTSTEQRRSRVFGGEIDARGPWFHNLHLPDGRQTSPRHWAGDFPAFRWREIADHVRQDLAEGTCLDIGCNAGFYTFELARRGGKVLGIGLDERHTRQARWAAGPFGKEVASRVRFERMQVDDLARLDERFDLFIASSTTCGTRCSASTRFMWRSPTRDAPRA